MAREESLETRQLIKRLDAIINILLETSLLDGKSIPISKRVEMLSTAGLRPIEISRILSIKPTHVRVALSVARKKGPKGRRGRK